MTAVSNDRKELLYGRPIPPLISRHAQDAAWYWTQMQSEQASPLLDAERLAHFQRLLVAHLDGLRAAGTLGRELADEELERWNQPPEAFVCWVLALESGDERRTAALWAALERAPDMYQSLVGALEWMQPAPARSWIERQLAFPANPAALAAAVEACAMRREACALNPIPLFRHESALVRTAVCRLAGNGRMRPLVPALLQAMKDPERQVREAAALALLVVETTPAVMQVLREAVLYHNELFEQAEGRRALHAEQRAQLLARWFGHALSLHAPEEAQSLLESLPPYLRLLSLAHYGDPALIPDLLPFLVPDCPYNRRALWALSCITGCDPNEEGLCQPDPVSETSAVPWPEYPGSDADAGLPEPAPDRVTAWWAAHAAAYEMGTPYVNGWRMTDPQQRRDVLLHCPQAQRFAAAFHVTRSDAGAPWIDTRAPLPLQRRLMELL